MCKIKPYKNIEVKLIALFLLSMPLKLTASTYTYQSNKGLTFAWQTDDIVGITTGVESYGYTEILCFLPSNSQRTLTNTCSLYAVGCKLKEATKYYSYFPYEGFENSNVTAVSLTYSGQKQTGNGSTAHLGSFDYCTSEATPANNACTFSFHHLNAFLRISFTVPKGTNQTENLILGNNIPTSATLNLKSQGTDGELTLGNGGILSASLSGLTVGTVYTAYVVIPKVNLTGKNLEIKLGSNLLATIKGFNAQAGYLYNLDLAQVPVGSHAKGVSGVTSEITEAVANPVAYAPDIPLDTAFTLEILKQQLLGDVNNDGKVDIVDAVLLNGYYISGKTTTLSKSVCDLNGDNNIDIVDVIAIISKILSGK